MRVRSLMWLAIGLQLLLVEGCGTGTAPVPAPSVQSSPPSTGGAANPPPASGGESTPAPALRKVTLEWAPNPPENLAGYKIHYSVDSPSVPFAGTGAAQGNSPVDVSNQTTAVISGLDPSRTYYFAVTAYNAAGQESPYSNIVSTP